MNRHHIRLALLATVVLALPAQASANVNVEAARTPEGNAGLTRAYTEVTIECPAAEDKVCEADVVFTAGGTATAFKDYGWDPPKHVTVRGGEEETVVMLAEIVGDRTLEPNETYKVRVTETNVDESAAFDRTYVAGVIVDDDGKKLRPPVRAPVMAPESMVERFAWDDGTSVGRNCVTKEARGYKGAFGSWGYYIPGCVTAERCPEGRTCRVVARSTITSSEDERVTLNSRARVLAADGSEAQRVDVSCAGEEQCTAADESLVIPGGTVADLTCNASVRTSAVANVECNLDLQFQ